MQTAQKDFPTDQAFDEIDMVAHDFIEKVWEELASHEMTFQYEPDPEEIPNRHISGFIPWTSGGYQATVADSLSYANSSGCAPKPIQHIIDSNMNDVAREYCRQNEIDIPESVGRGCLEVWHWIQDYLDGDDKKLSDLYELEHEWFAEDCYFWKIRAVYYMPGDMDNESGEPEIYFDVYLNTDLNYGRDNIPWLSYCGGNPNQTKSGFSKTITVSQLKRLIDRVGADALSDALAKRAFKALCAI